MLKVLIRGESGVDVMVTASRVGCKLAIDWEGQPTFDFLIDRENTRKLRDALSEALGERVKVVDLRSAYPNEVYGKVSRKTIETAPTEPPPCPYERTGPADNHWVKTEACALAEGHEGPHLTARQIENPTSVRSTATIQDRDNE